LKAYTNFKLLRLQYIKHTLSNDVLNFEFELARQCTTPDQTLSNTWCNTASRTQALGVIGGNPSRRLRGTWYRFEFSSSSLKWKQSKCTKWRSEPDAQPDVNESLTWRENWRRASSIVSGKTSDP